MDRDFTKPIPQELLNITDKKRANLFAWRGQFSPQLVETLLQAYCLPGSVVLDPFSGSGTVLLEAGRLSLEAYGFEINPAAWILSKIYEFINRRDRLPILKQLRENIDREFPLRIFTQTESIASDWEGKLQEIRDRLDEDTKPLFKALIVLLDLGKNNITNELIQHNFFQLTRLIEKLPYSEKRIEAQLSDARTLLLPDNKIDFIVTSPPYINVFNYHQNYRKSAEFLGWNLLKIAKSEIGSNRANRGNRFYTVIQYCLDIADTLIELSRVGKNGARVIVVVGHESNVLGVPFYNADIIEKLGTTSGLYQKVLRQKRTFKNKFGKIIREDLISFYNLKAASKKEAIYVVAREIAAEVLQNSMASVSPNNFGYLEEAIKRAQTMKGTPILDIDFDIYRQKK